jgi:hypothetical protein
VIAIFILNFLQPIKKVSLCIIYRNIAMFVLMSIYPSLFSYSAFSIMNMHYKSYDDKLLLYTDV